jgi:hypothetical protein
LHGGFRLAVTDLPGDDDKHKRRHTYPHKHTHNLQVMVPHIEHVLPMIPGGASFKDIIVEGDGSQKY